MTVDQIIEEAAQRFERLQREQREQFNSSLTRRLAGQAATMTEAAPTAPKPAARHRKRSSAGAWIANSQARRVPNFVIAMTDGLDTKAKITAKYGEGARFAVGKPLPPLLATAATTAPANGSAPRAARSISKRVKAQAAQAATQAAAQH